MSPIRRRWPCWLAVALALTGGAGGGCSRPPQGSAAAPPPAAASPAAPPASSSATRPPRRPDVVLISLDTLRCDALGPWRRPGQPSVTPRLDALAAEGIVFADAYAPMPWTLSSHMSMLTGLDPDVHGVLTEGSVLSRRITTLPETLHRLGYLTLGLATANWLDGAYGFDRGFDFYRLLAGGLRPARVVDVGAAALLRGRDPADRRPLFLFLHYYDAHSDFADEGNRLPYFVAPELLPAGLDPSRFCHQGRCATEFLTDVNRGRVRLGAAELAAVAALYEGGVRGLDADLGALFDFLRQRGTWDDALVIVTADHGEEFLEHGKVLHDQGYRETARVPLLVKLPRGERAGTRVEAPVGTVELAATVLAYLEAAPESEIEGRDLLAVAAAGDEAVDRPILTRGRERPRPRYFLRTRDRTLVFDPRSRRTELYDLAADPGESEDLAAGRPREVAALARQLAEALRGEEELAARLGAPADQAEVLDAKQREALKALGYLH